MGLYWADGTVTGSVDVVEDEAIQKLMKATGKRKLAAVSWPIESAAELADQLDGTADDDDETEAKPSKAAKASEVNPEADADAEAASKVDLPALLDKATAKKGSK